MCKEFIFLIYISFTFVALSQPQPRNAFDTHDTSTEYGDDGNGDEYMIVCDKHCGCDSGYYYNKTTGNCMIKKYKMKAATQIYDTQDITLSHEGILARNVRKEVNHIFKGIIISAILIITCAVVCILFSCVYCCRINYSDHMLNKEFKELEQKIGRNKKLIKTQTKPIIQPLAESCPVIVEEAGLFVV